MWNPEAGNPPPQEPTKKDLTEFSKEHYRRRRYFTAEEIARKRKEHFEEKKRIRGKIDKMLEEKRWVEERVEEVVDEIKWFETRLSELTAEVKTGLASRIASLFKKADKDQEPAKKIETGNVEHYFQAAQSRKADYEARLAGIREEIARLNEALEDKSKLDEARAMVDGFYGKMREEWNAYMHEREARQIDRLTAEHQAFFIHGILMKRDVMESTSKLVKPGLDWKQKLKIILAIQPSLATYPFTFREGQTAQGLWSNVGVILRGGEVSDVVSGASYAKGLKERRTAGLDRDYSGLPLELKFAAEQKREVAVNEPVVAGIYVSYDVAEPTPPLDEVRKFAQEMGLPLFEITGSSVLADKGGERPPYNQGFGGVKVEPADLVKGAPPFSEEMRRKVLDEIAEGKWLKTDLPE